MPFDRLHTAGPLRVWRGAWLVACLVLLGGQWPVAAADYLLRTWAVEEGLPNSSVTAISQTRDGYLWVGTYNGLARFDGVNFRVFNPENTPELRHARIRRLFLDGAGTLWINTYDGSLTSWRAGRFTLEWTASEYLDLQIQQVPTRADRVMFLLPSGDLIRRDLRETNAGWEVLVPPFKGLGTVACEDAAGTLWYRGRDSQLYRRTDGDFEQVADIGVPGAQLVRTVVTDARGQLWVGSDRGMARWTGEAFVDETPTNSPTALDTAFLYPAKDGGMWAVMNERLRRVEGRRLLEDSAPWGDRSLAPIGRLGAHEEADGSFWFYHYGQGLVRWERDGMVHRFTEENLFPGEKVDCFFEDREGNVWAGVDRGGLVRLQKRRFQVVNVTGGGQAASAVSVCEDQTGALWTGTFGDGLVRWHDGRMETFTMPGGRGRGFVFSVHPGTNGMLWLSAGDEDLHVFQNGRLERVTPWIHAVKCILPSRDGKTVWLGTKSGLFVCTNVATRVFVPHAAIARSVDIRALAEDGTGVLWAGGGDGNLYRVEGAVATVARPDGTLASPIWSLLTEEPGTVWAGTFRGGLLRYREGKFHRFRAEDGLPDNIIAQILPDDRGNLWFGSHQGIFRVTRSALDAFAEGRTKSIPSTAYGRFDGLPALECSGGYQPAAWAGRDGRLWFATLKGVVSIQPGEMAPNLNPPPVVIEEVRVDGESHPLRSLSPASISSRGKVEAMPVIEIAPGKRQFELHYAGLSFTSPDKVRFRYQLEGLENEWVEAGTRRFAQYSFLRPGNYIFRMTACNNEGVWNPVGAALQLRVHPHFYETVWFWPAVGMLVLATGAMLVRQSFKHRLRRELERLERQRAVERDRARIAKDIHDDLGAGLTQITLLSELARRDTPEAKEEHISHISTTARELTRGMDEIVWAINPQNDTLDGLVTYISKFAQQYLTVAGIRCRLDVPSQLPACPLGAEIRHNLYLAIKETLNNVVKHARATEASLRLECFADRFVLTIADNGRGLKADRETEGNSERSSSGHGLGNMARRLESIGGGCDVVSEPGRGTTVAFTVRVKNLSSPVLATVAAEQREES